MVKSPVGSQLQEGESWALSEDLALVRHFSLCIREYLMEINKLKHDIVILELHLSEMQNDPNYIRLLEEYPEEFL